MAQAGSGSTLGTSVRSLGLSVVWLSCCVLWAGCANESRVALLELDPIVTAHGAAQGGVRFLERGAQLELTGAGFPLGHTGEARFLGTVRAPGRAPAAVELTAPAVAMSTDRLEVPADALLAELGARGTFEGLVEVAFAAQEASVTLTGTQRMSFDYVAPHATSAAEQHALRLQADKLLARIGLVVETDATTHDGVQVKYAHPESAAALLGLRSGDLLVRAAGVNVHTLGDLVPPPMSSALELHVLRPGSSPLPLLRVPLDGAAVHSSLPLTRMSWLLAWAIAVSVLFGSATPLRKRAARLVARLGHVDPSAQPMGLFGAWPPLQRAPRLALAVVMSFAGVLLVCFEPAGFLSVRSITLYLPIVAVGVALALMQGDAGPRVRIATALALLGRMTVMGAVLACACALAGTRALDGIVATQGALPSRWGMLQCPALLAAIALFVVYGAQIGDASPHERAPRTETDADSSASLMGRLLELERVLTNVVLSSMGAAIFWGGWQSPAWLTVGPWPERLPGALLFVLKAWCMAWLLARARRARLSLRALHTAGLCLAMVALTVADVLLEPAESVSVVIGQGLCIALVAMALVTAISAARARLLGRREVDERLWIATRDA